MPFCRNMVSVGNPLFQQELRLPAFLDYGEKVSVLSWVLDQQDNG
jgi:hypothetical protein